jgi:hypothetical protein
VFALAAVPASDLFASGVAPMTVCPLKPAVTKTTYRRTALGRKRLFNDSAISMRHYAFLISEDEFDQVFSRIRDRWLMYWADPGKQRAGNLSAQRWPKSVFRQSRWSFA